MIKRLVSWIRTAPKPTESQIELALAMARHRAALDELIDKRNKLETALSMMRPDEPNTARFKALLDKCNDAISDGERALAAIG